MDLKPDEEGLQRMLGASFGGDKATDAALKAQGETREGMEAALRKGDEGASKGGKKKKKRKKKTGGGSAQTAEERAGYEWGQNAREAVGDIRRRATQFAQQRPMAAGALGAGLGAGAVGYGLGRAHGGPAQETEKPDRQPQYMPMMQFGMAPATQYGR